jgi:hypothetical protein
VLCGKHYSLQREALLTRLVGLRNEVTVYVERKTEYIKHLLDDMSKKKSCEELIDLSEDVSLKIVLIVNSYGDSGSQLLTTILACLMKL